jgi:hypothetical protein
MTVRKKRLPNAVSFGAIGVSKVSSDLKPVPLVVAPKRFDGFNPFDFLNFDTFDLWRSSPEKSATYGAAGLERALPFNGGMSRSKC